MGSQDESGALRNEAFFDKIAKLYDVDAVGEATSNQFEEDFHSRYKQKEFIDSGGMKSIACVHDLKIGRDVAMASLKDGLTKEYVDVFLREAKLTALLDHPNIIRIYDIGFNGPDFPYFTMELKKGGSFREVLEQSKKGTYREGLEILNRVCDAISYAHSKQVLHLDLKPINIEIGEYGEVIVCDWGCGKILQQEEDTQDLMLNPDLLNQMTIIGKIKGTPGYMAPEQIEKGGEKTIQTDIYALGVILYEILYHRPLISGSQDDVLEKTTKGEINPLDDTNVSALNAVILKAINIDPKLRYRSVEEFQKEIKNYLSGFATIAESASLFKLMVLFYKRHSLIFLFAIVFSTILVISGSWYIYSINESRAEALDAKEIAEKQRMTALLYRSEAEKNVELLQKVKLNFSKGLFKDSRLLKKYFYEDPKKEIEFALNKINEALKLDPNNHEMIDYKAEMLFMIQNFKKANELYSSIETKSVEFKRLANKYKDVEHSPNYLIPLEDLNQLLHEMTRLSWRRSFAERMIAYDYQKRKLNRDYLGFVSLMLKRFRSKPTELELRYNEQESSLKIISPELFRMTVRQFGSGLCVLRFVDIVDLDISHTKIGNLSELNGLVKLKKLNISHTLVTNLKPLKEFDLETLFIHDGQFTEEQLSVLPKTIKIVIL